MQNEFTNYSRRSIRLKKYDYSQCGAYFVTICVQDRRYLFGEVVEQKMKLNKLGEMIDSKWKLLAKKFELISLGEYIIMPNHFHAIIFIDGSGSQQTLGQLIGLFKSVTSYEYAKGIENNAWRSQNRKFWQRNYYEHVIRNEKVLFAIKDYIIANPRNWHLDRMNLALEFKRGHYM